MKKMYYFCDIK